MFTAVKLMNGCQNLNKNPRPEKSFTYENKIT